jgi:hypothetical protein
MAGKANRICNAPESNNNNGGDIMVDTVRGYVYSTETMEVIAEVTGKTRQVEQYVDDNYDTDTCGLTFSPAFGFAGGLIDVTDKDTIVL